MKTRTAITVIALIASFALTGFAQDFDLINHPGFVNLDDIEIPDEAIDVTEVSIGPELFQMISDFAGDEGGEDMPDLGQFVNIQVKTFDVNEENSKDIRKKMSKLEKKLKRQNWKPLVRVRSGGEFTNVSVKYAKDKKKSMGFFVMSLDPNDEAAFVNIVGSVDVNMLRNMNVGINGSALDSLKSAMDEDIDDE